MLVLTRKAGESFVIGDHVTVTVVRITGGGVRIGIEAPPDYLVVREELRNTRQPASASTRRSRRNPNERRTDA
jgi:carbon storage regulator